VAAIATVLCLTTAGAFAVARAVVISLYGPLAMEGRDYYAGADEFLTVYHDEGIPTLTAATGEIHNTTASHDWSSYAHDSGYHVGVIADAEVPFWKVELKTIQPVRVYGDGTTLPLVTPSHYYRSEAQHAGYARFMGEVQIWDGAHYHIGNNQSDVDGFWRQDVSPFEAITLAHKVRSSGELKNESRNADGTRAYDERTCTVQGPGFVVDWFSLTHKAHLVHRPYWITIDPALPGIPQYHHVELDVNMDNSLSDGGKLQGYAEAWDLATNTKIQTFVFE
jgi:hypothetical protein